MSKKVSEAVLSQGAEVRIGEYSARLTEGDLQLLYRLRSMGDAENHPRFIGQMIDAFINYASENPQFSQEVIGHMAILQDIKRDYRHCSEIDVRRIVE